MASSEPDIEEIRQCLQVAGVMEENMSEDLMRQYYKVIKESEVSLIEETKNREGSLVLDDSFTEAADEPSPNKDLVQDGDVSMSLQVEEANVSSSRSNTFSPKQWLSKRKSTASVSIAREKETMAGPDQDENNPPPTLTKVTSTKLTLKELRQQFNSMDPCDCPPFKPALKPCYPPVRRGYPVYCHPQVLRLPPEKRLEIIERYHEKYLKLYQEAQLRSRDYAPWPKSINLSSGNGKKAAAAGSDLLANNNNNNNNELALTVGPEAASFGCESDFADLAETSVYTSRSGRRMKRKIYAENESAEADDGASKRCRTPEPTRKKSPVRKRMPNEEIMRRSSLFADAPKRTRKDELFDKVKEEAARRTLENKRMQRFTLSLKDPDGESDDEFDVGDVIHCDEPFQKPKHAYGKKQQDRGQGAGRGNPKAKTVARKPPKREAAKDNDASLDPDSGGCDGPAGFLPMRKACPICNQMFDLDQLTSHAGRCGEVEEESAATKSAALVSSTQGSIMCDVCDKMFTLNADYEVHVVECIAASRFSETARRSRR